MFLHQRMSNHRSLLIAACLLVPTLLIGLDARDGTAAAEISKQAVSSNGSGEKLPDFAAAQVQRGELVYRQSCASCHGAQLEGAEGPTLHGAEFLNHWANGHHPLADLHFIISNMMPFEAPGSLSKTQYLDVLAYLLAENGYSPGTAALDAASMETIMTAPDGSFAEAKAPVLPAAAQWFGKATTDRPADSELAQPSEADWLMYNKNYRSDRYSQLAQITAKNVRHLQVICEFQAGEVGTFEANPVVYDGLMYITTPYNTFALNPTTCRKVWEFDFPHHEMPPNSISRGVALYKGNVFRPTPDGHLIALDAKTGKQLWDVWLADSRRGYWLSAAPIAYHGKVFIGEAGADFGVDGHIYAFDAETGKRLWTFDVIAQGDDPGAKTWKKGADHGGGSMWSSFTLDPARGQLLASIGNPAPDYNGALRPGDNLYTNSVVALNIDTGKLAWYVQQVPHDTHDWDTAAAPVLYGVDDRSYMAVANKGGWLYIYDAKTRQLLRKQEVTTHLNIDKPITFDGIHICPGIIGGVQWNGPAYSPLSKALFVNAVDWCGTFKLDETRFIEGATYFGGNVTWDPIERANGWVRAFNAATGEPLWTYHSKTPMIAAITPTAGGLIFTGDLDGDFMALDAANGQVLYRFNTGGAVAGAAATYLISGKQYVAETSGNASRSVWRTTGSATVLVFGLAE